MFPYEITEVEESLNKELIKHFEGDKTGFCQVGPKKWLMPIGYADHAEKYYTMPLREDDLWIATYPRSGTTLCQELLWLINNNLDYEKSSKVSLDRRFPFYEFPILFNDTFEQEIIELNDNDPAAIEKIKTIRTHGYKTAPNMPSPRHIKTHLPFSLLPQGLVDTCKVVYVARNPMDVAVSYYHHNRLLRIHGFVGEFPKYWEYFKKDLLLYSPYWDHLEEGWKLRNNPNVLFLFYENLVKDMRSEIVKVARFLNKPIGPEQVAELADHLQIENFRKAVPIFKEITLKGFTNASEQGFIRKGKVGGNKEFTPELLEEYNEWVKNNLSKTDLRFPVF